MGATCTEAPLPLDSGNVSLQELAPARTFLRSINIHRQRCRNSLGPRERHYPVSMDPLEPFFDKIHGRCIHSSEALRGAAGASALRRAGHTEAPSAPPLRVGQGSMVHVGHSPSLVYFVSVEAVHASCLALNKAFPRRAAKHGDPLPPHHCRRGHRLVTLTGIFL